jgi:hypothetical protein
MEKRDSFAADLIRAQVLEKNRRALLIFGDGHLWRKGAEPTVVSLLSRNARDPVFGIGTPTSADLPRIQADAANWPAPSIALLKDTVLGAAPFAPFYATRVGQDVASGMRGEPWDSLKMEDQFDALLYLGSPETITLAPVSTTRCAESGYMSMRMRRMALVPWGQSQIDRLKSACAAAGIPSPLGSAPR